MGAFSELAIERIDAEDDSYPSEKMRLKWRIEDLEDRLREVSVGKIGIIARRYKNVRFSKDDLKYTPPVFFSSESDIMEAISIAEEKLSLIEVCTMEIPDEESPAILLQEVPGQLTIWNVFQVEHADSYIASKWVA